KGIYRTTNSGTNWFQSHDGIKALKIDGIHASNGYVFAAGDAYGYFRSSDHGDTWTEINNGVLPTAGWFCFARVGGDILAGAGSSLLYRSSDTGDNWTLSNTGFGLINSFAFFVEGNTVYTTGLAGVAKSTDGGLNWTTLSSGYLSYEGGLDIWKDGSNILTGSNLGKHRSTDDGATWSTSMTGITGAVGAYTQIDSTLFAASAYGVYKSTDHGANWTATAGFSVGVSPQCLAAIEEDLYVGTNDGVYRSTNKGISWTAINQGLASKTLVYKMAFDDEYLYAGTNNRSVWRRPLSEITDVREVSDAVPNKFSLEQNYPNPFNPTTNFGFRIVDFSAKGGSASGGGLVTLKIFDILGREVAILVNEELHPGTFSVSWDATGQASGIYYYRLQVGDFSETRKLLLTK
ncbi:MAG: T9SS type A sorting domain-containing protein, partial [Ignavibacteriales bacterium]|nr:T9SS type A sorting domain-containing protein [Ignavibacteriales bacterium]